MGIPKFYRWLSERCPLINQPGGATVVPIIDNFYLDMNGIIHNCTHDNNPDVRLTEEEMIIKIFTYLDKLFHIVRPQKLIFMAIDGVAPRAKMNQQRARRFKAAREAEEAAAEAARRGDPVPDPSVRFDSNGITPGTPFMARLGSHLRFFIRKKISEDPAWQKPTVVFSGHDVPGEGEHKIMEYIRWAKKSPGYAPNTRHCLYGLDADLIMLSLVTHEPHFCLLREVVSYGGGNRGQPAREVLENPCQEHFVLLQIGLLRDYFDLEFRSIAATLPFPYDLERIIDDFVLFCMLVGNDFLPPLPTVDINEGSLDSIMVMYRRLLPKMGGYITFAGELHRDRLEMFLKALAEQEADVLEARAVDAEEFEAKQDRKRGRGAGAAQPAWAAEQVSSSHNAGVDEDEAVANETFALEMARMALQGEGHELELLAVEEGELDPAALVDQTSAAMELTNSKPAAPTMMSREARALFAGGDKVAGLAAWRQRYYGNKLNLKAESDRRSVVTSFIEGLHWVMEYYYRGVASWNWFYPHHYAPMVSDCTDLASIEVRFTQGQPFLPYEQLLSVQPSSSCRLLPEPYRWLMTDPKSPIADFYPTTFDVDLEGKRADWEGVVLIPFIDETRLLKAARSIPPAALSADERERNKLGHMLVFAHSAGSSEVTFCASTLPGHYSSVAKSNSTASVQAAPPPLPMGEKGFTPATVSGTRVGSGGPPGFPTLRTLAVSGNLRHAGCNIFGMPSKKESLILAVKGLEDHLGGIHLDAERVAAAVVGHRTWVKWPYLQEAHVEAVSDGNVRAGAGGVTRLLTVVEADEWQREATRISNDLLTKQGLDLGHVSLLLHVRPCEGLLLQLDGSVEKRFGKQEAVYPLQVTLRRNPSPDPRFEPGALAAAGAGADALIAGAKVMFLGRAHYGCLAEVLPARASIAEHNIQTPTSAAGVDEQRTSEDKSHDQQAAGPPYRLKLVTSPPNAAQAAQAARRILTGMRVQFLPSGQVARRLSVSPRTLGRLTGNVWVRTGSERHERVDVGLCVKNAAKGLYVPDYCQPLEPQTFGGNGSSGNVNAGKGGWAYSDTMIRVLQQYRQRFPFVWTALEQTGEGIEVDLKDLLPGVDHDTAVAQVAAVRTWLKSTPLARRPLVKTNSKVAAEDAVRMLQAALPPRSKVSHAIEMENVGSALILPPLQRGGVAAAFAGGTFELADRVAAAGSTGVPAFGLRGTVVGIYEDAVEVLFDEEFLGGTDLYGRCNGNHGGLVPASELLNLSRPHAIRAEGDAAPRAVKQSSLLNQSGTRVNGKGNGTATGLGSQQPGVASALTLASRAVQQLHQLQKPVAAPTIPDKSGGKGFSMGRGRGRGLPQIGNQAASPGSQSGGAQLLAQLKSADSAARASNSNHAAHMALPVPQFAAENSGSALLSQLQQRPGGTALTPAFPQPSSLPGPMQPEPLPHVLLPPFVTHMRPIPGAPPPMVPPHLCLAPNGQPVNPGTALLSQLKAPKSPGALTGAPSSAPEQASLPHQPGSLLLQQLKQSNSIPSDAKQPESAGFGPRELSTVWQRLQQEEGGNIDSPSEKRLDGKCELSLPQESIAAAKHADAGDPDEADAFWDMLSQTPKK